MITEYLYDGRIVIVIVIRRDISSADVRFVDSEKFQTENPSSYFLKNNYPLLFIYDSII